MLSYLKGRASKLTCIHVLTNLIGEQVIHTNDHSIGLPTNATYELNWGAFLLEKNIYEAQGRMYFNM